MNGAIDGLARPQGNITICSLALNYSNSGSMGGSSYGFANIERTALSETKAAISPAYIEITRPDLQVALDPANATAKSTWDNYISHYSKAVQTNQTALAGCAATDAACKNTYTNGLTQAQQQLNIYQGARNNQLTQKYIDALNHDVNAAHQPLAPVFDARQATDDLELGAGAMAAFTRTGYQKAGDYAKSKTDEAEALRQKAKDTADEATRTSYINQANAIDRLWGPSGLARAALHAVVGGAAWGSVGALASASNVLTETALSNLVKAAMSGAGLSPDDSALYNVILATAKTALSGALGGAQGATAAFNADANNRMLHLETYNLLRAACSSDTGANTQGVGCAGLNAMKGVRSDSNPYALSGLNDFLIAKNYDETGKVVGATLYDSSGKNVVYIMDKIDFDKMNNAPVHIRENLLPDQVSLQAYTDYFNVECSHVEYVCYAGRSGMSLPAIERVFRNKGGDFSVIYPGEAVNLEQFIFDKKLIATVGERQTLVVDWPAMIQKYGKANLFLMNNFDPTKFGSIEVMRISEDKVQIISNRFDFDIKTDSVERNAATIVGRIRAGVIGSGVPIVFNGTTHVPKDMRQ